MNTDKKKIISEYFRELGKKGGNKTKEIHGSDYFRAIAKSRKGQTWKWAKEKKGPRKKKAGGLQKSEASAKV